MLSETPLKKLSNEFIKAKIRLLERKLRGEYAEKNVF